MWESNTLAIVPIDEILEPTSLKLFLWNMYYAIEQKNINDKGELEATFDLKDFGKYFNIDARNSYPFVKKWTKKIKVIIIFYPIQYNKNMFKRYSASPTSSYENGFLTTTFHSVLNKNSLELKDNKIFIELKHLKKSSFYKIIWVF